MRLISMQIFLAAAFLLVLAAEAADSPADMAIDSAAGYLLSCQNQDGGFGAALESDSDIKDTSLAAIALAAWGKNLSALAVNGTDPLQYLLSHQEELDNSSNSEAQTGRYVVALAAGGLDPRNVRGKDYVSILKDYSHPDGGLGKENYIWDDAWILMALAACNESQSNEAKGDLDYLKHLQSARGGWSWNGGDKGEDPDTTGIILCALISGGENTSSDAIQKGLNYLSTEQNVDGGFSALGSNAATDGWAMLAIRAAGQNPEDWKVGSADPVQHLLSLQQEDGAFWWKSDSQGMSFEWTANAILALTGGDMPPVIYSDFE